jgi:ribosomal 50S subunit-associated protein YjgA (DUF615 family)
MENQKLKKTFQRKKRVNELSSSLEQIRQICINQILETQKLKEQNSKEQKFYHITNLYDRMTIQTFKKLNDCVEKYPHTFNDVVYDLQNNIDFYNLKYRTIYNMWIFHIIDTMYLSDINKHFHC